MEPRILKSERDTQIVIEKKFNIKKGDDVKITYLKNDLQIIVGAKIEINDELIGNFELEELEEFLTLFLAEPM
jgi:hypothetical protein